ncbi:MAG: hypothetical protein AUK35_00615 [Zetaproteobacteria bacterium CG2_30_46_52]|nr:MAG: hypothetical protein AUK35_00615 [Zetaproteobacteria bacterium CG2_30_46_52]
MQKECFTVGEKIMSNLNEDKQPETPVQTNKGAGNVEQIREILLGSKSGMHDKSYGSGQILRELEKRFDRLEDRVNSENRTLRSETNSRLDALESYIKEEIESMQDVISNERKEREENQSSVNEKIAKASAEADRKHSLALEKINQSKAESRNSMLDQSKSLLTEIQVVRDTLTSAINRSHDELHMDKTDRKALANMFNELALSLNGEFDVTRHGDKY